MYGFGIILIAFFVGPSSAIPVGFGLSSGFPYNSNYYQPCFGPDPCTFPYQQFENIYPSNYLTSAGIIENDVLATVPEDIAFNYPYVNPRTVNVARENYARNYGFGSTEVGVRDQVSLRSNVPAIVPPYSRLCSYLPISTCFRGARGYPLLPIDYGVAF